MRTKRFYKFFFIFFNSIGVLHLKFKYKKFETSQFRFTLLFIFILLSFLTRFYKLIEAILTFSNDIKLSKFSQNYMNLLVMFNILSTSFWTLMLSLRQKNIAEIFETFLEIKRFCELKKLKIFNAKLLTKNWNSLFLFNFICFSFLFTFISSFKDDRRINNFVDFLYNFFFELPSVIYPLQCLNFVHLILNHYEILLENLNQILEDQFDLVHNDCEFLIQNFVKIHKLFNLLNQSFGIVFSVCTIKQFINVSAVVSSIFDYGSF